jgi:hypothetical protein
VALRILNTRRDREQDSGDGTGLYPGYCSFAAAQRAKNDRSDEPRS